MDDELVLEVVLERDGIDDDRAFLNDSPSSYEMLVECSSLVRLGGSTISSFLGWW